MLKAALDFLRFGVNPIFIRRPEKKFSWSLFFLFIVIIFPVNILLAYTNEIIKTKIFPGAIENNLGKQIIAQGLLFAIIVTGIIVPFIEELLFRSYLTRLGWNLAYVFINISIITSVLLDLLHIEHATLIIAFIIILGIAAFYLFDKSRFYKMKILRLLVDKYKLIFYLSAITFGIIHIGNYDFKGHFFFIPILLVLPQVFAGIFLGYVRTNYGLRFSILFHALNNLIAIFFLFKKY